MFRVVGRDFRGASHEISVCATTEEEARANVLKSGTIVTIDCVSIMPPSPAAQSAKPGRWAAIPFGCVLCLGFTVIGTAVGLLSGHMVDILSGEFIQVYWLIGSAVGAMLGLIMGVKVFLSSSVSGLLSRPNENRERDKVGCLH